MGLCQITIWTTYLNKRPERPYPALRYSEKGQQVSEGDQPSASDLQKF